MAQCAIQASWKVEVSVHLNNGEYAEHRGALVLIHRGRGNKTEAFEELVGVSTGWDTWGVWKHKQLFQKIAYTQVRHFRVTAVDMAQLQFPWLQNYLQLIRGTQVCSVYVSVPLGVLAVNSGSKQNVSSGLPAAGLNGGCSSLLYSF